MIQDPISADAAPARAIRPSDAEARIDSQPGFDPAAFARMVSALDTIERGPVEAIEAMQWKAVGKIAAFAAERLPFWEKRLEPVLAGGVFDPRGWREVPILTRQDVQRHVDQMQIADVREEDLGSYPGETSGSTGVILKFTFTGRSVLVARAMVERLNQWHGIDPESPAAIIFSFPSGRALYPDGETGKQWCIRGTDTPVHRLSILTPPPQQMEWLRRRRPRYLMTLPTNAGEVAREGLHGGRLEGLDAVLSVGEVVSEDLRSLVREGLGARIVDNYACDEVGKIALQCEVSGHYHVCRANVLVEVVDEDGQPVGPGETGRVVVTGLHNAATPFIRYALGDYAVVAKGNCPCGRTLPTLERILGRSRNMLVLPGGRRLWFQEKQVRSWRPHVRFRQYQVVQTAHDRIEFRYVPEIPGFPADGAAITALARQAIHPDMTVVPVEVASIARSPTGKFEDVISLVTS